MARSRMFSKQKLKSRWSQLNDLDISDILSDTSKLVQRVQERYDLSLDDAREQVSDFLESVGDAAVEAYDRTSDVVETAAHRVENTIRKNPLATIAGALLVGGMLGYLIGVSDRETKRCRWL